MVAPTVKARSRTGTNSLELTIPTKIVTEFQINEGDIFTIDAKKDGEITLIYKRVFKQKDTIR